MTERDVVRFGVDKTQVPAPRQAAAARALAKLVDLDPAGYVARVQAAGPKAFVEAIVLRTADADRVLRKGAAGIKGVATVRDTLPLAPTREFARPILGTVGPVTAEIVKARTASTGPATRQACPGSRRGTTSGCAARRAPWWRLSTPRARRARCSACSRRPVSRWSPRSTRTCRPPRSAS